jgi:hypothetical protein
VIAGPAALSIMVIYSGDPRMPARAGMCLAGCSVALLVCIWMVRPGVGAFCTAQRRRRWGAWSLIWLAAGGGAAPVVGVVGVTGGVIIWQVIEIQKCMDFVFPADSSYCLDWYDQCIAEAQRDGGALTREPCEFAPFWPERWRQHVYGPPPTDLFGQIERAMLERHTQMGWTDARNRQHVQAVADDWAEVLRLRREEGLVAVAAHVARR